MPSHASPHVCMWTKQICKQLSFNFFCAKDWTSISCKISLLACKRFLVSSVQKCLLRHPAIKLTELLRWLRSQRTVVLCVHMSQENLQKMRSNFFENRVAHMHSLLPALTFWAHQNSQKCLLETHWSVCYCEKSWASAGCACAQSEFANNWTSIFCKFCLRTSTPTVLTAVKFRSRYGNQECSQMAQWASAFCACGVGEFVNKWASMFSQKNWSSTFRQVSTLTCTRLSCSGSAAHAAQKTVYALVAPYAVLTVTC